MADAVANGKGKGFFQQIVTALAVAITVVSLTYTITTGRVTQKIERIQEDITTLKVMGAGRDAKVDTILDNLIILTAEFKDHMRTR